MWTSESDLDFILRLSQEIVEEVAPEEIDIFDEVAAKYLENPNPPDLIRREKDDPLSFGLNDILVLTSPAAIAMVITFLNTLTQTLLEMLKDGTEETVKEIIKELFKTWFPKAFGEKELPDEVHAEVKLPTFSREQLQFIRDETRIVVMRYGITDNDADQMINILISKFALGN